MNGKTPWKRILCGLLALVLVGLAGCTAPDWDPESWFPLWEEPGEPPASRESVSMWFLGVEPYQLDEYTKSITDLDWAERDWFLLRMGLRLKEYTIIPSSPGWWIDYYYQGAWHTVYREEMFDTSFAERLVTRARGAGLSNAYFLMPSVVLEPAGRYRLCYKNHGTFPFYILGVHNEIIV